jgi:hypothetical protein
MVPASTPLTLNTATARKKGWTLAGHAGEVSPDGVQRLSRRGLGHRRVRDDVRGCVIENLGDRDGVLAVDRNLSL